MDRLGKLHVFDAVGEGREFDFLFAPDRIDEFLLDAPFGSLVIGNLDLGWFGVALAAAEEPAVVKAQDALIAKERDALALEEGRDRGLLKVQLRAAFHIRRNFQVFGNFHRSFNAGGILPGFRKNFSMGRDAAGGSSPAHDRLVVDAEHHDVHAAEFDVLPPVQRRLAVEKSGAHTDVDKQ